MAERPLPRAILDPLVAAAVSSANLTTAQDVLSHSAVDLMEVLNITHQQAMDLFNVVSLHVAPPFVSAQQLLLESQACTTHLPTRLAGLDAALRRGVPAGSITELVGPAGVGKSQVCLMLALFAAMPQSCGGLGRAVIYIDTERKFSSQRLVQMATSRFPHVFGGATTASTAAAATAGLHAEQQQQQQQQLARGPSNSGGGGPVLGGGNAAEGSLGGATAATAAAAAPASDPKAALESMLAKVLVMTPGSSEELMVSLGQLEAGIISQDAALVVIDSIAALLRAEAAPSSSSSRLQQQQQRAAAVGGGAMGPPGGGGGMTVMERQALLGSVAARLKHVAEAFKIPVVVTNQVTTRMSSGATTHGFQQRQAGNPAAPDVGASGGGGAGQLVAALGTKWAHCVNVRLVLDRLADRRFVRVAKSPAAANVAVEYSVTTRGVEQVEGGGELPALVASCSVLDQAIMNEIDYGI